MLIFVEGQIGSGKSMLLRRLKSVIGEGAGITFVQEPVDEWTSIVDDSGNNILQKFYTDGPRWAFTFQLMAFITRMKVLREARESHPHDILVVERSVFSDKYCFATLAKKNGIMSSLEWDIYDKLFSELMLALIDEKRAFIYVKVSVDTAISRIMKRGRPEEATITKEYLTQLHDVHEEWMGSIVDPRMITDGESIFEPTVFIRSFLPQ